jgi:hypothetical protein
VSPAVAVSPAGAGGVSPSPAACPKRWSLPAGFCEIDLCDIPSPHRNAKRRRVEGSSPKTCWKTLEDRPAFLAKSMRVPPVIDECFGRAFGDFMGIRANSKRSITSDDWMKWIARIWAHAVASGKLEGEILGAVGVKETGRVALVRQAVLYFVNVETFWAYQDSEALALEEPIFG